MAQCKGAASEVGHAVHLMKKREKQQEQMEQKKQWVAEENILKASVNKGFSTYNSAMEAELKSSTVGLVTLNDMKTRQEVLVKEWEEQLAKELQLKLKKLREKDWKEAKKISSLSFTLEDEEKGNGGNGKREVYQENKLGKNSDVDMKEPLQLQCVKPDSILCLRS